MSEQLSSNALPLPILRTVATIAALAAAINTTKRQFDQNR